MLHRSLRRIALCLASVVLVALAVLLFSVGASEQASASRPSDVILPHSPASAPPLYLGLDAYRHWEKLSYLEVGDRVWGQSTADPGGSNSDNSHIMRVLPSGEHVLFDQLGPGVMTWMRMQVNYGSPWKLYLNGSYRTTVSPDDLGQASPTTFPSTSMPYPISMNIPQTQGSSIVAATIPFTGSMTWTSTNPNGNFYSLYRKLPYGSPLQTWTGAEPINDVAAMLRQAGSDIAPAGTYSQSGTLDLPPGQTDLVTLSGGPSQIRAVKFRVPYSEKVRLGNSRLRIYWDGEVTPSVDTPIKFLAGDGAGVYQPTGRPLVQGWIAGAGGDGSTYMNFNMYWPMPYTGTARIAVASPYTSTVQGAQWTVRTEPFSDPPGWWGRFHANYTDVPNPPFGEDMTFLDVAGSGRVVGTVVNFSVPNGTLEGDPHFFIDDNNTPQVQVTGTEEWGTGGNYWNGGNQTSLPVGGLPSSLNNPPGEDIDGSALYRFLVADTVPFNRHITLRWEHGVDNDSSERYRAAIFWYGTPTQTALLSDSLLVGDAGSRKSHGYASPGATSYLLNAAYEYPVHNPLSSDTGISTTGVTSFTMMLDPANVGAFLRRKFDYALPNQRADIFIDNQPAGTWYTGGSFSGNDIDGRVRRWREEEFPLPASLTADKSSVVVRVQFVPTTDPANTVWTEFAYSMYSFVMPLNSGPAVTPTPASTLTATYTSTPTPFYTATTSATRVQLSPTPSFTASPGVTATLSQASPSPTLTALPSTTCTLVFSDVPPGSPFYPYVYCLACRGIVGGYADGSFRPANSVTRGEAAKFIANAGSYTDGVPPGRQNFADVTPGTPFWLYIERLYAHGIIGGYRCGGQGEPCPGVYYRPDVTVSRGQLAKLVSGAAAYTDDIPSGRQTFEDVSPGTPFWLYIERLYAHGIVSGYPCGSEGEPCPGPYYRPSRSITRGQSAKITARTFFPGCMAR